jgi:RND family efflux transporter MFP subunit
VNVLHFPKISRTTVTFAGVTAVSVLVVVGLALVGTRGQSLASAAERAAPVGVMALKIEEEILINRQFLGRLEANQTAELGFEFGGIIAEMSVREGDIVRGGDVLAQLTQDALVLERQSVAANLESLQSRHALVRAEITRLERLVGRGAAPSNSLDRARAEALALGASIADAEGGLAQLDLRLRNAVLTAPFDAIVGATRATLGEAVGAGQPIISLFERGRANFRVGLPMSLHPAALQNPRLDINGQNFPLTLSALRPDIDIRSNTRIALFAVAADDVTGFGQTATLMADLPLRQRGAWVPVDAMRPAAEGFWTLLSITDDMVAEPIAIDVRHLRGDMAFVSGLFEEGTKVISVGAHKIVPGQTVRAE